MRKTDTVVFDLDGTLLNTLDDLKDSVNFALSRFGFSERSYEEIRSFVGNGVRLLVERAVPKGTDKAKTDECFSVFTAHYEKNMNNKTRPYDGVYPMLAAVKAAGYKTAVVSNKYDSAVKELIAELFGKYIDVAVGEVSGRAKKPAPDGVFAALGSLGSSADTAVYVGDSDVDYMTAVNSELPFIGVTWGFKDKEFLIECGAKILIDRPEDLIGAIRSL